MLSQSTLADVAVVIFAATLVIFALTVLLLVYRRGLKSVSVDTPMFKTKLEAVERVANQLPSISAKLDQINIAVNHQPAGARTLVQRLIDVEQEERVHRAWAAQAMHTIAEHLGIPLDPPPDSHIQQEAHS